MRKYGDATIVQRIIKKQIWQGATGEQMVDSLGKPADIDETVMKTKIKTVWKYHKTGKNRYKLRVTLENDIVIGWEFKG